MMDQLRGGRDYQTLFDPDPYIKEYRAETSDNCPFVLSYMESLQKIYSQGKLLHKPFFDLFFSSYYLRVASCCCDCILIKILVTMHIYRIQKDTQITSDDTESYIKQDKTESPIARTNTRDINKVLKLGVYLRQH